MSVEKKVQAVADALFEKSIFLSTRERSIVEEIVTAVSGGSKAKAAKKRPAKKRPPKAKVAKRRGR